jgi:UDP-glucose 4-epimerase
MSVMVTGGAGYIGSHMVLDLLGSGETVVVLDNLSTGFRSAIPEGVVFVEGDIGDQALVEAVIRDHDVDAIAHFAGSIVVPESVAKPLDYYDNNTCKARNLIEASVRGGVKHFIFSSTAAIYGASENVVVTEDDPPTPISPYGSSKLMTEMILRDVSVAHDFRYVALRYFNVVGCDPQGRAGQSKPEATHLFKVACQAALGQRPALRIFGTDYHTKDGTGIRDYIHVSDLISAHLAALTHLRDGGESQLLNCGYGHGYSVLEIAERMRKVSGVSFPIERVPRREGDPAALIANADRLREILGWVPKYDDLDLIMEHTLAWERHLLTQGRTPADPMPAFPPRTPNQ